MASPQLLASQKLELVNHLRNLFNYEDKVLRAALFLNDWKLEGAADYLCGQEDEHASAGSRDISQAAAAAPPQPLEVSFLQKHAVEEDALPVFGVSAPSPGEGMTGRPPMWVEHVPDAPRQSPFVDWALPSADIGGSSMSLEAKADVVTLPSSLTGSNSLSASGDLAPVNGKQVETAPVSVPPETVGTSAAMPSAELEEKPPAAVDMALQAPSVSVELGLVVESPYTVPAVEPPAVLAPLLDVSAGFQPTAVAVADEHSTAETFSEDALSGQVLPGQVTSTEHHGPVTVPLELDLQPPAASSETPAVEAADVIAKTATGSQYWDPLTGTAEEDGALLVRPGVADVPLVNSQAVNPSTGDQKGSVDAGEAGDEVQLLETSPAVTSSTCSSMWESITNNMEQEVLTTEEVEHAFETEEDGKDKVVQQLTELRLYYKDVYEEQLKAEDESRTAHARMVHVMTEVDQLKSNSKLAREANEARSTIVFGHKKQLYDDQKQRRRELHAIEGRTRSMRQALEEVEKQLGAKKKEIRQQRLAAKDDEMAKLEHAGKLLAADKKENATLLEQREVLEQKEEELKKFDEFLRNGAGRVDKLQGQVTGLFEEVDIFKKEVESFLTNGTSIASASSNEDAHNSFPVDGTVVGTLNPPSLSSFDLTLLSANPPGPPVCPDALRPPSRRLEGTLVPDPEEGIAFGDMLARTGESACLMFPPWTVSQMTQSSVLGSQLSIPQSYGSQDLNVFRPRLAAAEEMDAEEKDWVVLSPESPPMSSSRDGSYSSTE